MKRSWICMAALLAPALAGITGAEPPAAPVPDCVEEQSIGRMDFRDARVEHAGLLLGRWQSPAGVLTLRVSLQLLRDHLSDAIGGTWQAGSGALTSVHRVTYAPGTRVVTLASAGDGPPVPFSRLVLEPAGSALVVEDADGHEPPMRLRRESTQRDVSFERFTRSRTGLSMRAAGGTLHVTARAGTRASGRLTGTWPMSLAFVIDVAVHPRASTGFAAGSFVCVGVVNDEPKYWDPHRHIMAGRIQRANGGAFSMETFSTGEIRRFASVPAGPGGGRLRLIREHGRIFTLYDDGRGWMPIATQQMDLWDHPRLVLIFGNHASRGAYPALDFTMTDLRVTGE